MSKFLVVLIENWYKVCILKTNIKQKLQPPSEMGMVLDCPRPGGHIGFSNGSKFDSIHPLKGTNL